MFMLSEQLVADSGCGITSKHLLHLLVSCSAQHCFIEYNFRGYIEQVPRLPLGDIIRSYGISFHCYVDDTQIYIPVESKDSSSCFAQHVKYN